MLTPARMAALSEKLHAHRNAIREILALVELHEVDEDSPEIERAVRSLNAAIDKIGDAEESLLDYLDADAGEVEA